MKMSRRDLLVAGAAAVLLPDSSAGDDQCSVCLPGNGKVAELNVIFHGSFAFIFNPKGLRVMAPPMSEHAYGLGMWRKENIMMPGRYSLEGVTTTGTARPDPSRYVVVYAGKGNRPQPDAAHCYLDMPLPNDFRGLRTIKKGSAEFFKPSRTQSDNKILPSCLPLVTVVTYWATDSFSPATARVDRYGTGGGAAYHIWTAPQPPYPLPEGYMYIVNLHVFAEPAFFPPAGHVEMALHGLNGSFASALDLALRDTAIANPGPYCGIPNEIPPEEEGSLAERHLDKGPSIRNCIAIAQVPGDPPA